MKKSKLCALLIAGLLAIGLAGCGGGGESGDSGDTAGMQDGDKIEYRQVTGKDVPENVQKVADKCAGKREYLMVREGDDFYVLLSAAAEGTRYSIGGASVRLAGDSHLIAIDLKEDASAAGENEVKIYRVEKMTFEDGLIFQMAADPALTGTEQGGAQSGNTGTEDDDTALDGSGVELTVAKPKADETLQSGKIDVSGSVRGNATEVRATLETEDGKKLGEATGLVANVSHEYMVKLAYSFDDDTEKGSDGTVQATLTVTCLNESGIELTEKTINVKIK